MGSDRAANTVCVLCMEVGLTTADGEHLCVHPSCVLLCVMAFEMVFYMCAHTEFNMAVIPLR